MAFDSPSHRAVWTILFLALAAGSIQAEEHFEPIEFQRLPAFLPMANDDTQSRCVAFSADGKWLASGDDAGRIFIRASGAKAIRVTCTAKSQSPTTSVQFLTADKQLASLHTDGKLRIWSTDNGSLIQTLSAVRYTSMAFSPGTHSLLAVTEELTLEVWKLNETDDPQLQRVATEPLDAAFTSLSASRNGAMLLATASQWQVWQINPLKKRLAATLPTDDLTTARISPDGKTFATGFASGKVRVRESNVGGLMHTWERHPNAVTSFAFSSTGKTLISGCLKDRFRVWDLSLGEPTNDRAIPVTVIQGLELSPDNRHLAAVGSGGEICFLDTRKMTPETAALATPRTWFNRAAFATRFVPNENRAAVIGKLNTPQFVDLDSGDVTLGTRIKPGERLSHASLSRDASLAAYAYSSGIVRLYDSASGELRHTLDFESRSSAMAFRPDAERLAVAIGRELHVVDCKSGEVAVIAPEIDSIRAITSIAWSPEGDAFFLGGPQATGGPTLTIIKCSADDGKSIDSVSTRSMIGDMAISDDGMRLVTGGITGLVCVFNAELDPLNEFEVGGRGGLHAFKILNDRLLAVGTYKGSVLVADMMSGEEVARFEPLPPSKGMPIRSIDADLKRNRMIAVGGWDGEDSIRLYSLDVLKQ